jgi:hypothetical protein
LEYSLYQAELNEISKALEEVSGIILSSWQCLMFLIQIEDERRQEVVNAEERRKEFGKREKEIEVRFSAAPGR